MFHKISALMNEGRPVSVLFTSEEGRDSPMLYCELIQKARSGDSFLIKKQGCSVGAYVLGNLDDEPVEYYYSSGRYRDINAAKKAVSNLHRLKTCSIKITPYQGQDFDVLILFLKPERAMRLVQAFAYTEGDGVISRTGGTASVCSECTAYPVTGNINISPGCKGSRKHSKYSDDELVVGIPFNLAGKIEKALGMIPETTE